MKKIRIIVNVCIVIVVIGAWIMMVLFGEGTLSENGIGNLRFFTVLSNLFEGTASAIWLLSIRNGSDASGKAERLKYIAAASVGLTFVTVMLFLGPLYGYGMMFIGPNLFFHLLIPVAAMAEIILLSECEYTRRDNDLAVVPPFLYGVFYIANIAINGIGEWPDTNDWYLFLAWGYPIAILIFAALGIVTWLIAFVMRKLHSVRFRSRR